MALSKNAWKITLLIISFVTMGALISTSAQISCGGSFLCNPNPIDEIGSISLLPAGTSSLGGIYSESCTGTNKVNGINTSGNIICATDNGGSGVVQVSLGNGLIANQTPISSNATLYLKNSSVGEIGGVRIANCTALSYVSGWDINMTPICSVAGTGVYELNQGEGIVFNESPIMIEGTIYLNNATTTTIGGVQVLNCSGTDKISGWTNGGVPVCSADQTGGGTNYNWTFVDRTYFSKTKTNVGLAYVDVYDLALDPSDFLFNTTGVTQFRVLFNVDYVSASSGVTAIRFVQNNSVTNVLYVTNFTADVERDSAWTALPSWALNVETFLKVQINSSVAADDPVFKGYQVWLR